MNSVAVRNALPLKLGYGEPWFTSRSRAGLVLVLIAALAACHADPPSSHSAADSPKTESAAKDDGPREVTVSEAVQHAIGLRTVEPEAVDLPATLPAIGRVLDPTPLVAAVAELGVAEAAARASDREWERLKSLVTDGNSSRRALEAAEAAATRDRLQAEAAHDRLLGTWGRRIAERSDVAALVRSLSLRERAVVRLEVAAGLRFEAPPRAAQIEASSGRGSPLVAEFLESSPFTDPQTQGRGYLFLTSAHGPYLAPDTEVSASIYLAAPALRRWPVPRSALVEVDGKTWVFVQQSPTTFRRHEVSRNGILDDRVLITRGLGPGQRLVVDGAQILLSEELKPVAAAPEAD